MVEWRLPVEALVFTHIHIHTHIQYTLRHVRGFNVHIYTQPHAISAYCCLERGTDHVSFITLSRVTGVGREVGGGRRDRRVGWDGMGGRVSSAENSVEFISVTKRLET